MKAGDKITFNLCYTFSDNGQRLWYKVESFRYVFSDNPSKEFYCEGDRFKILDIVESLAKFHNLGYREINTFNNIHKREYEFVEEE